MIIEAYRCIVNEEFLKFKELVHKQLHNASCDPDVNDVDMELFRMHLIDLQEGLDEVIQG